MSYLRYRIDLAVKEPIPAALEAELTAIEARICGLHGYSEKINEGLSNEEDTVRATKHICRHDTGEPCDPEQDLCKG